MKDYPKYGRPTSSRLVRKAPPSQRKGSLRLLLGWVLLFAVAFFFVQQRVEFIRTERRVEALMRQKQKLLAEILPLKLEESYLTRIGKVEAQAETMGLQRPGAWQKFTLAPPKAEPPPAASPAAPAAPESPSQPEE